MTFTKDNIFDVILPEYNYVAADMSGVVYAFQTVPLLGSTMWTMQKGNGACISRTIAISPWWTDWKNSLISRPADESKWLGKWCYVWDSDTETPENIGVLMQINKADGWPYVVNGTAWERCRPVPKAELLAHCYEPE